GPGCTTAKRPRAGVELATLTARSRASQVLQDLGAPPMTPTPCAAHSPSTSQPVRPGSARMSPAATTRSRSTRESSRRGSRALSSTAHLGCLGCLAAAGALALARDDLGGMGEPIDERHGTGGIGKDRVPVRESEIGGEHDRALLVAAAGDLEEEVRG